MDYSDVLSAANALSINERIQLVEAVWDGIAAEQPVPELSEAQKQELRRRIAEMDASPEIAVPWEEVRARAEARLKR